MFCDKCGAQIPDGSKFCPECGNKVEIAKEPEIQLTIDPAMDEATVVLDDKKEWYFVENNQSVGTFSDAEMNSYLKSGRINETTFVWKAGMDEWKQLSQTALAAFVTAAVAPAVHEPVFEEPAHYEPEPVQDNTEWYYIGSNSAQNGPFNKTQIIDYIKSGAITENTYVWATGMQDWVFAKNSELSSYFVQQTSYTNTTRTTQQTTASAVSGTIPGLAKKNIAVCILLSIVTCGFYGLYWLYTMIEDTNKICSRYGNEIQQTSGGMVILLSIVTCGIYLIYWFYKVGKRLSSCTLPNGYRLTDDSMIMLVLAFFGLSIVSYCILQSTINDVVTYTA